MDLESFYKTAPKPNASNRSELDPADAKVVQVNDGSRKEIMLTVANDGPVSLLTPKLQVNKTMSVSNLDELVEKIFDMV